MTLPGLNLAGNLAVTNTTGSVLQSGAAIVVGGAATFTISGASGDVILNAGGNNIASATFNNSGTGTNQLATSAATLSLGASNVSGTLALTSSNSVVQTGALTVNALALIGAGGSFALTDVGNSISVLAANTGGVQLLNAASGGLTVGAVGATTGITASGNVNINQHATASNLTFSAPMTAGSATLSAAGQLSGTVTTTGASNLTLGSQGGVLTATVNGQTGAPAASLITLTTGFITVNGVALSTTTAPVVTTASVATVASVASVATTASVASVATAASLPSLASVASVAPVIPTTASGATTVSTPFQTLGPIVLIGDRPFAEILAALAPIPPTRILDLFLAAANIPEQRGGGEQAAQPSAQLYQQIVTATPSGAFIPLSPPSVASTGAPLISTQTIKVDAADTGGANGQVIAGVINSENNKPVLPGLLSETTGGARATGPTGEPSLSQLPSEINSEPFLD